MLPVTSRLTAGRSHEDIAALADLVQAEAARMRVLRQCPTALALAQRLDRTVVRTPAMGVLDAALHECTHSWSGRLVVSIPPQEGKSTLARWSMLRLLVENPSKRIVFASYAAALARSSGRIVRSLVETHGPVLGVGVDRAHRDASDWQLDGHTGGLFTVGIGGALTGKPADVLLVDDPIRNQRDADSEAILQQLHEWWEAVGRTRLAPGAPVVVIQTRWSEHDLAGRLGGEGWPVVNIPALADGHVPDALGREPGTWLKSTRGRSVAEWEAIRSDVGERVFAALYQGAPSPPGGGIFLQEWFDRDRVTTRPSGLPPIVVVDPADNTGSGDEAGIVVASTDTTGHRIYLGPDYSATMTTARWVRVALLAVLRHEAAALAYERSLSGLDRAVRDGWATLRKQAKVLRRLGAKGEQVDLDVIEAATAELTHLDDPDSTRNAVTTELIELWLLLDPIAAYPDTGPVIRVIHAKGSKQLRAQLAAPLYENRRVSHIGRLAVAEHQMAVWQPGQDSPDRMDAVVHALLLLSGAAPASLGRTTDRLPTRSTRNRGGTSRLARSTRR